MSFRQPFIVDKSSNLYMTKAQFFFFCNCNLELVTNLPNLTEIKRNKKFKQYLRNCALTNYIYDYSEKNPDEILMYWSEEEEDAVIEFNQNSNFAKKFKEIQLLVASLD